MSIVCLNCGKENPADSYFCEYCGLRLKDDEGESGKTKLDVEKLDAPTMDYSPEILNLSQTTKVIVPETVKVLISVEDYKKLNLARKVEDLFVWNLLSQLMLGCFFTLLGVSIESNFSDHSVAFFVAFFAVGIGAVVTTAAYWLSIYRAKTSQTRGLSDALPSDKTVEKEGDRK